MRRDLLKYRSVYGSLQSIYSTGLALIEEENPSIITRQTICNIDIMKLLLTLLGLQVVGAANVPSRNPSCRFALQWTQEDILRQPDLFEWDLLYWEGKFHQNNVSYNEVNGMSYDGTQLDLTTGERTAKHPFSAASKEVQFTPLELEIMLLIHCIRLFRSWSTPTLSRDLRRLPAFSPLTSLDKLQLLLLPS